MTKGKIISFSLIMLSLTTFIGWVFWKQELQYSLPTPVPSNFVDVKIGGKVNLKTQLEIRDSNPVFLHFFNLECPCSRFNLKEFESLAHKYKNQIHFFVVIQSEDDNAVDQFKRKYELDVPTILDKEGIISDKCGIYSTPQAVLLDKSSALYFKGNYTRTKFCTLKETKFVEIAINYLLKNEPLPLSMQYALSEPYGCSLPSDKVKPLHQDLFSLFQKN
jgi:hypothetical protein